MRTFAACAKLSPNKAKADIQDALAEFLQDETAFAARISSTLPLKEKIPAIVYIETHRATGLGQKGISTSVEDLFGGNGNLLISKTNAIISDSNFGSDGSPFDNREYGAV
jgi:hypothetical protein